MISLYYISKLWPKAPSYHTFPILEIWEQENTSLQEYYKFVDRLEEADFGIVSLNIQFLLENGYGSKVDSFIVECRRLNKKVLIFTGGDYGHTSKHPNVITVRLGGFESKLSDSTFIMSPFFSDPHNRSVLQFSSLEKSSIPTLGFVGHSNGTVGKMVREWLVHQKLNVRRRLGKDATDIQRFYPSSRKRFQYLSFLEKAEGIQTDFIHRDNYRAGADDEAERKRTEREFYENMQRNLYTFCMRGTGNFSVRFFETLAMGRIPVLLNTDCRLPFPKQIEWSKHIVSVDEKNLKSLPKEITEFHDSLSEEACVSLQRANRNIWLEYFQKESYCIALSKTLEHEK
ncbi:exostosin domain-containing protein [Luteirhabdus pelagi]|uniref:exostosin domain-containing protein n=1 Tax=Luteirhabdus pelagi TaxID=2792783 RepID=UPI001939D6A5|nr:exostosin family protein [Luteirhabdus pelagi]